MDQERGPEKAGRSPSTADEKSQRLLLAGKGTSQAVARSTFYKWKKKGDQIQRDAEDPIFAGRKTIRRNSVIFQVGPRLASFQCEWYSQLQEQGQAISETDFKKGIRDKAVELDHELKKGQPDHKEDWGKNIVEFMRSWRKTFSREDGFPGEEELAAWRASNSSSRVVAAGPATLLAHGQQQQQQEKQVPPWPCSSGFHQLVHQTSSQRGQKRHCASDDRLAEAVLRQKEGQAHKYRDPPIFPDGEGASDACGLLLGVYEDRGSPCSFRWVLGAPSRRGASVAAGDDLFRSACAVGVDWVLANMESLRERYGEPKGDPAKREVVLAITAALVGNGGPSASVAVTAGLVAFCWGTKLRPDAVATGEITLTGAVLAVGGIKEKVQAACRLGNVETVYVPQGCAQPGTGQLFENVVVGTKKGTTVVATTASPTPGEGVEEGKDDGEQGGQLVVVPVTIDWRDDPEVWRRLEDGSLRLLTVRSMWEILEVLVEPPPGRKLAPQDWMPFRGGWQACVYSPWLNQDGLVCMQLVEVSLSRTGYGFVGVSGVRSQGPAFISAVTANVFVRTCLEAIKAKLPYPPRNYDDWLMTDGVEGAGELKFQVHYPPIYWETKYVFSAAVAVGMVAVMFGKMVALHTVVMGDLGPNGGLIELPPMHSQHFHSMLQAGVRKVYMPRGNAEQMMALPEYPGSGLEVVAMVSLLDHIADILSPMP